MLKKVSVLVFFAVLSLFSPVHADQGQGRAVVLDETGQQIEKIVVTVPVSIDKAARTTIVERLSSMEALRFVYLDLSVVFPVESDSMRPYTVSVNGKSVEDGAGKGGCGFGALLMGAGVAYDLAPVADYNHLMISVYTGDRADFPYHDISCEYLDSGQKAAFRVRGFFHVLGNSVPTALGLQLRPFNPPLFVAAKVLSR
jgi:hypothetical protein